MNRPRPGRRGSDLAALAAARAAAAELWLEETIYTDEVLASAIAASARVIGLRATTRLLPDVGAATEEPPWPSWDRVPRLLSPRFDDPCDAWEWISPHIPDSDECPRLWRRLGFSCTKVLFGRYGHRDDEVAWSRLSNGALDRYFYYLSGSGQGDFYLLFTPLPATRAGRRHALLDLLDETFSDLGVDSEMLYVRADAATCRQLARRALDVHGVPLQRVVTTGDNTETSRRE